MKINDVILKEAKKCEKKEKKEDEGKENFCSSGKKIKLENSS